MIRGLTLLVGLEVLDWSSVCWETFCLESALTGAVSGGLGGSRASSDCSAGPGGSFWISGGTANTSWCKTSGWLLGRLLHPREEAWGLL